MKMNFFTPYVLYFANRVICANHDFYYYRQRANSIMNIGTNLRERSGSLYFISAKLTEFAKSNIASEEIKQAFLLHASSLCSRAQLYMKKSCIVPQKDACLSLQNIVSLINTV